LLIIQSLLIALFLLMIGDFIATFLYHVPEHVFGKYHQIIHHSSNRSFIRYAITHKKPQVLMSGFLAVTPYIIPIPFLWHISSPGVILGLIMAEMHVIWRHNENKKTPSIIVNICQIMFITTPEIHQQHHQNINSAYGDIFTFYNNPAKLWFKFLSNLTLSKIT
jgi:Fatty acid hydroxylase superfamily